MTDQVGVAGHGQRNASPWQAVGLILLLTTCLSGIFWALINVTQTPNPYYVWLMMWMAGISALLTCRILRRPLSTLGWTWNWRWVLIGYLIPIVYCLAASLGIWIFGIGGFPNTDVVHQAAESLGLRGTPDWVVIAMFVVVQGTAGMVAGSARRQARKSGGAASWCPSWRRCCRSPEWRCCPGSSGRPGIIRSRRSSTGTSVCRPGSGC